MAHVRRARDVTVSAVSMQRFSATRFRGGAMHESENQGGWTTQEAALLRAIDRAAARACRAARVPEDEGQRVALRVFQQFRGSENPSDKEIREAIERGMSGTSSHSAKIKKAAKRCALGHPARMDPKRGWSVPPLCPRLARLAPHHADSRAFTRTLVAGARHVAPLILRRGERLRLFDLAYGGGLTCAGIGEVINLPNQGAVWKRIRRASDAVESEIARRLRAALPGPQLILLERVLARSLPAETSDATVLALAVDSAIGSWFA